MTVEDLSAMDVVVMDDSEALLGRLLAGTTLIMATWTSQPFVGSGTLFCLKL